MKIAFLGLGNMGAPIVKLLLKSRHEVAVWNRTAEKARALAAEGAVVADRPAEAVNTAEIVFTMLNDDAAVESVVLGTGSEEGLLKAFQSHAVHVSLSTISVQLSQRLTAKHAESGKRVRRLSSLRTAQYRRRGQTLARRCRQGCRHCPRSSGARNV